MFDRAASGREAARFWRSYGREIGASLISPLNSALWRQSAGGIQKRSGICFFMDLLIMSRTRSTHWNYPRHWMVCQSGYSGGCQITAERSASTPSFGGQ